jgi:hypothetical protein
MLRTFELHEYRPKKNSLLPHFVIAERKGTSGLFEGVTVDDEKRVWTNADDAAQLRSAIEKEHGLDLYVVKLHANGIVEEISWPKSDMMKLARAEKPIETPGAGTW